MFNVLSIDVEDYFHVEAFAARIPVSSWDSFEPRVQGNIDRLLHLFRSHGARGTFFVLGWVADRFPGLVRQIAQEGHEIGCHGYSHQRLHQFTPETFREDVRRARRDLMDQAQQPVLGYRAPTFSIVEETIWAFDILEEEGFQIDSSVFPVRHDLYGMPHSDRFPHWRTLSGGRKIFEFPPSTIQIGGKNWGMAGGGYLRFFPYRLNHWAIRQINDKDNQPAMVYLHPWEIDPGQPRIKAGLRSQLRHYTNLGSMENKVARLLQDFPFSTLSDVCGQMESYRSGISCR